MKQNNKRRAMILLWGCIAVIALCIAGALAVLLPLPKPETLEIPGQRGTIPATIQMPGKLSRNDETPLVVLCHGFTGNRGGDTHFTQLAQDLAEQGMASVRMDFAGCGESAEPDTAYTLGNMTQDVDSIIAYMQQTYGLDGPIALVGHSMGGRLASLYPQQGSYPVDALVLWSPANGTGLQGLEFLNIDDFSQVEAMAAEALANGKVSAPKWNTRDQRRLCAGNAEQRPQRRPAGSRTAGAADLRGSRNTVHRTDRGRDHRHRGKPARQPGGAGPLCGRRP